MRRGAFCQEALEEERSQFRAAVDNFISADSDGLTSDRRAYGWPSGDPDSWQCQMGGRTDRAGCDQVHNQRGLLMVRAKMLTREYDVERVCLRT